jgi:preprotein translocase subunit YajC
MRIFEVCPWLAQNTVQDPRGQTLYLVLVVATMGFMFYFGIFRPQQKKQKEHERLLKNLKRGDKVVTSGGIVGIVVGLKEKTVCVRSEDAKLELLKSAVSEVVERAEGPSQS